MKTNYLELKKLGKLTDTQYQMLSHLAYYCWKHDNEEWNEKYYYQSLAFDVACELVGIDFQILYDVKVNKNYSGLQNYDTITSFETIQ